MNGKVEKLLQLLLILEYSKLFHAIDFTDVFYLTAETQTLQQNENTTEISTGYTFASEINDNNYVSQLNTTEVSEENYIVNKTQTLQQNKNTTEISSGYTFNSEINDNNYVSQLNTTEVSEENYIQNKTQTLHQNKNTTEISSGNTLTSETNEINNNSTSNSSNIYSNNASTSLIFPLDTPTEVSRVNFLLNETDTVQSDENDTEIAYVLTSGITQINNSICNMSNINNNDNNNIGVPTLDPLIKIAIIALVLHIFVIGGGVVIYSFVYCRRFLNRPTNPTGMTQRMQSPLRLQHSPNTPNCPCHGCRVARQFLYGLVLQQVLEQRSEC